VQNSANRADYCTNRTSAAATRRRDNAAVPYNADPQRIIHDADAHIMEPPTWLRDHADPSLRDRLPGLTYTGGNELRQTGDPAEQQRDILASFDRLRERHASDEYRRDEAAEVMIRKNFAATGSFIAEDRPRVLDLLGFESQLLFNTFHNRRLHDWEHCGDLDLAAAVHCRSSRRPCRGPHPFCRLTAHRQGDDGSRRRRCWSPPVVPPAIRPVTSASTRCGRGRRRRGSRSCSTWAAPAI
jgi:hypothetical protein